MASRSSNAFVFTDTDNGGVIHVANIKGGVGKSTVATNLASALAKKGLTLLIDLDVQGSATHAFGKDPSEFGSSSWHLFKKRYSPDGGIPPDRDTWKAKASYWVHSAESKLFSSIVGEGDITKLRVRILPGLDLIPATADLYNNVNVFRLQNFLFNLQLCRSYYKYIVIDTPSVWNFTTRSLYCHSDLNLIPVTLNALSTKSLRDYLVQVKELSAKNPNVRLRIVKNEVFGKRDSKIKGKTRTMYENRKFLDSLCEQVVIRNDSGVSMLPQAMMFDLEIPESATVRDAQDEGKPVSQFKQYSTASRAFIDLAKKVQFVLNSLEPKNRKALRAAKFRPLYQIAALLIFALIMAGNPPVANVEAPRPIAPQQLIESGQGIITHTFNEGESIYKLAKYALCRFRALVPSGREINSYIKETVDIYNKTRMPGEKKIKRYDWIAPGISMNFYPPATVDNPRQKELLPVYEFFVSLVKDDYPYITGDWCERGSGGGRPHYGIDIAGALGAEIVAPVGGTVYWYGSAAAGRTLGIVNNGTVIFFSHMHKRYFKSGDKVEKGDAIGTIGMTGRTSGPHVHIGYGIQTVGRGGARFGNRYYEVTDPKLFFYKQMFTEGRQKAG
ncbi:MAG: AAA family ATPase [Chitinivibrionales bacterium]|nr:AAA family ATPase [Chitinivibrionales bacterium]